MFSIPVSSEIHEELRACCELAADDADDLARSTKPGSDDPIDDADTWSEFATLSRQLADGLASGRYVLTDTEPRCAGCERPARWQPFVLILRPDAPRGAQNVPPLARLDPNPLQVFCEQHVPTQPENIVPDDAWKNVQTELWKAGYAVTAEHMRVAVMDGETHKVQWASQIQIARMEPVNASRI